MTVRLRRRADVLLEDVPGTGEAVLVDRERARVVALNAAGAAVWELLDGARAPADLARLLRAAAPDPPPLEVVLAEVDALLAGLEAEGLVEPA